MVTISFFKNLFRIPPLPCSKLHEGIIPLDRFHATCLWCIVRRYHYDKVDRAKYVQSAFKLCYIPKKSHIELRYLPSTKQTYILIVDDFRHFAPFKNVAVKLTLKVALRFERYNKIAQRFFMLAECISNV